MHLVHVKRNIKCHLDNPAVKCPRDPVKSRPSELREHFRWDSTTNPKIAKHRLPHSAVSGGTSRCSARRFWLAKHENAASKGL